MTPYLLLFFVSLASVSALPVLNNERLPKVPSDALVAYNVTVNNRTLNRNIIRPGMVVSRIAVEILPVIAARRFSGVAMIAIEISDANTIGDDLVLQIRDLDIQTVSYAIGGSSNYVDIPFVQNNDDNLLVVPGISGSLISLIVTYEGNVNYGFGVFSGSFGNATYLAMNLSPTNARRVFPCIDELTETPLITIGFNGLDYGNLFSNTIPETDIPSHFRAARGPPLHWAFIGHDFTTYVVPTTNVILSGRPGVVGQESQASVAINSFFNYYNQWTDRNFQTILVDQASTMQVIAIPDISTEWNSLSIVGIWEPYVLMEIQHSVKQREVGLLKIAEALTKPWFGYVLFPENWTYQWVISGLSTYLAYEGVKEFMNANVNEGVLNYETIFVTDVIQESLRRDAYRSAQILEPSDFLHEEDEIRNHLNNGLLKYKAPALMSMLRHVLDVETDLIQVAARGLFITRSLETITSYNFIDVIIGEWTPQGQFDLEDFVLPYISQRGCPLLTVNFQSGLVTVSRSTFSYAGAGSSVNYYIPISFTTSVAPNFDNVFPSQIYDQPTTIELSVNLDEEDWILFNIQGRGYYRVQYNIDLWERIIEALEDPDRREVIHPMNRATLVDDSLNLARRIVSGLDYDIAFRIVLTMEFETEFAVWKAFIRNMNFLKKRLEAMVEEDEDLDPDIYLRMVRRTVVGVENELTFTPEININEPAMDTLTRAMVMDHACRAGYDPCIAAAVDLFYESGDTINSDIPLDLKPAVYCSVVREGGAEVRDALFELMQDPIRTRAMYDRVVILEALACSQDVLFIRSYLDETLTSNSPYSVEERSRIFAAVAESSYTNAREAFAFMRTRTSLIRERYGGSAKLEELIFLLADNMANADMVSDFQAWVTSNNNNLDDSELAARRALEIALEDLEWNNRYLNDVYEWIDENDAPTVALSMVLLCLTAFITLFN